MTLVFDDASEAGLGHRRRIAAVAQILDALGVMCLVTPMIGLDGPRGARVMVIDSYARRADDERLAAPIVVAIDDLQRDLAVDLVIDPCPGADPADHPSARRVLAGPAYAPLDPALGTLRSLPPSRDVTTILVATGGADDSGHGPRIAGALLDRLGASPLVRLAIGPGAPDREIPGVEMVRRTTGLGPDLCTADIVVTAGGVTLLEALALGRPCVAMVLYENQRRQAIGAARLGGAVLSCPDDVPTVVQSLLRSPSTRAALSVRSREIVDGHGAQRVAEAIVALL